MSTTTHSYRGNCHCGAFVYDVSNIAEISEAVDCNCSICSKKGYLLVFPGEGSEFKFVKGQESELSEYSYGDGKLIHKFCPHCSSALFIAPAGQPLGHGMALNAHAIQGIDTWKLAKRPYDGASLGTPYDHPTYKGDQPNFTMENGQKFTGSCHCGDLTISAINGPLETSEERIIVCNCSICERIGSIWFYPKVAQVVLHGHDDNIAEYRFGYKITVKKFCKRCGVVLVNGANDQLTDEDIAKMSDVVRPIANAHRLVLPINIRVLQGVDLSKLKVQYLDGAGKIPDAPEGRYINP